VKTIEVVAYITELEHPATSTGKSRRGKGKEIIYARNDNFLSLIEREGWIFPRRWILS
jgi:hypothetical protein